MFRSTEPPVTVTMPYLMIQLPNVLTRRRDLVLVQVHMMYAGWFMNVGSAHELSLDGALLKATHPYDGAE